MGFIEGEKESHKFNPHFRITIYTSLLYHLRGRLYL